MNTKLATFARVRELQGWQAVAFAAALLERMLPNYQLFCELHEVEGASTLRTCLDVIWQWLRDPKQKVNFAVQLEKVESLTPDPQQFDTWGVYPAVDAAIGLAACIQLMSGEDPTGAVTVSKLSQGSVEAYLFASEQADEGNVKQHPLMQFEIALQEELLALLAELGTRSDAIIKIKQTALADEMSNIGLEITPTGLAPE